MSLGTRVIRQQFFGILALILAASGLVVAATGQPLIAGRSNSANKATVLTSTGAGPVLSLRAKAGEPALKVNSNRLIAKLNADLLDGKNSAAFAPAGSSYTKPESDGKYAAAGSSYTKGESDSKYAALGSSYTKAESDENYTAAGTSYTKAESDANYLPGTGDLVFEIPPQSIVAVDAGSSIAQNATGASADVKVTGGGAYRVHFPLPVPSQAFGVPLKLKSVRLCYSVNNSGTKIDEVALDLAKDNSISQVLVDGADRLSTTPSCFILTPGTPEAIVGAPFASFALSFGSASHVVRIFHARVTLTQ